MRMTRTPKGPMMKRHRLHDPVKLYKRSRNSPATNVIIFLLIIFILIIYQIIIKLFVN